LPGCGAVVIGRNQSTTNLKEQTMTRTIRFALLAIFLALSACGGGGGGSVSATPPAGNPPPPGSNAWDSMIWDQGKWG
jgi:hypothetical protein